MSESEKLTIGALVTVLLLFVVLFEIQYVSLLAAIARGDPTSVSYLGAGVVWLRALAVFLVARRLVRHPHDVQRLWRAFLVAFVVVCGISLLELARNQQVTAILKTQGSLKTQPNVRAATDASFLTKAAGAK